jgi:hypothetical protein
MSLPRTAPSSNRRFIDPQACVHNECTHTHEPPGNNRKEKEKKKKDGNQIIFVSLFFFLPMIHGVVVATNILRGLLLPITHRHFSSASCGLFIPSPTERPRHWATSSGEEAEGESEREEKGIDPSSVYVWLCALFLYMYKVAVFRLPEESERTRGGYCCVCFLTKGARAHNPAELSSAPDSGNHSLSTPDDNAAVGLASVS